MQIKSYKILKELASSNFSKVYLAENLSSNQNVVIKELNTDLVTFNEFISHLRREAEYLKQISHKNVVKFLDYFEEKDKAFLVLEYIKGMNLNDYLKSKRLLSYIEATQIFEQMCLAVLEIHKNGIIHKDIKPNNFIIDDNNIVKLIDLGISIDVIKQDPNNQQAFTRLYASPEQIKGEKILDRRTDIYSLGKTFYFLLTGRHPDGETTLIHKQVIENEIKEFKDPRYFNLNIPQEIIDIIKKCLKENRDDRYQTVKQILDDLKSISEIEKTKNDFNIIENFESNFLLDKNFPSHFFEKKYWQLKIKFNDFILRPKNPTFIINLLYNYINRGNPTLCSLKLANWICDKYFDLVKNNTDSVSFKFEILDDKNERLKEISDYLSLSSAIQNSLIILLQNRIISFFDEELSFTIENEYQELFTVVLEDFLELSENFFLLANHDFRKPKIKINEKNTNSIKFYIKPRNFNDYGVSLYEIDSNNNSFRIKSSVPVPYKFKDDKAADKYLTYFLNNIFRFRNFRYGQNKIIKRALSLKNTIGLLPTGAGKSLCYQLIMFLQPAPIIIVEPIKSLIIDQHYNLNKFLIDRVEKITSEQSTAEREQIQKFFSEGRYLAIYISPERFQSETFRNYLRDLVNKIPISYAVIDEAHCVSEWGHDFRTSYLDISQTIRRYCNHYGFIPTFYALTGTASEIVLRDILADLEILEEMNDAVIRNYTFDRKELKFEVRKTSSYDKFNQLCDIFSEISKKLKASSPAELFKSQNFGAGLIFCPHVNSTNFSVKSINKKLGETYSLKILGVEEESKEIISPKCPRCNSDMKLRTNRIDGSRFWGCSRFPNCRVTIDLILLNGQEKIDFSIKHFEGLGMFAGKRIERFSQGSWNSYKNIIQMKFIEDKISCMISTKSFGMGIDKPNIRYTIHYNLPQSIESFYQEAGRAGRDGKNAFCYIIFSDDNPKVDDSFLDISKKADEIWELKNNSDSDISRNLFFQNEAYIGEMNEKRNIKNLMENYIYPKLNNLKIFESTEISIPNAEYNEKFLFRLKSFGLITDYVIDYSNIRGQGLRSSMKIKIIRLNPKDYTRNLLNYFKVRREKLFAEKIESEIKNISFTNLEEEIEYCIYKLISFVYEKIEPQRRASLRNMVDACRSMSNEEFRRKVLRYLSPDEEINFEFSIFPNSQNFKDWLNIIKKAMESNQVDKFLGVTLRIIESYPQEPGLLYISFALRMLLPNEDKKLIENEFRAFIRFYSEANLFGDLETAIVKVFEILLTKSKRDDIFNDILSLAIKHIRKDNLIKLAFIETSLSKTKVFLLTILLKSINEKLKVKQINLGKYERSK
ncbi:MAG: protein kinase [Ignavibacterium sp.]|nr:protein kinase [Ignavibacterium sp.]MDW8376159.1 protein kinase [Ignavibacteriales bacterium]